MRGAVLRSLSHKLQMQCHVLPGGGTTRLVPTAYLQTKRFSSDMPPPSSFLNIKSDVQKGVSVLEMKKKPVNSLSLEFLTEINIALEKFENDKSVRGVIFSSAAPVFCAGLDILEMYQPQEERLRTFWYNVQELAIRAFTLPKVVISAIEGPCIAGGCIFAWSSDYRVMSEGKHVIGLNETQLGLAAPPWLAELGVRTMGLRNAEKMLQLGELYTPQQALALGAVDEVSEPGKAMDVALDKMQQWMTVADSGRLVTKQMLRQEFADKLQTVREKDIDTFCGMVMLDSTQKLLGRYVEALKNKSKK